MVLDHLGIKPLFTSIYGSELNGKFSDKVELLKHVLKKEKIKNAYVVGDRGIDIEAAKKAGCISIGVSYGYGTKDELANAGADKIAETVGELRQCILGAE
jgi:phosphoglycolate phosphatase